jgi:hypothetical protein
MQAREEHVPVGRANETRVKNPKHTRVYANEEKEYCTSSNTAVSRPNTVFCIVGSPLDRSLLMPPASTHHKNKQDLFTFYSWCFGNFQDDDGSDA